MNGLRSSIGAVDLSENGDVSDLASSTGDADDDVSYERKLKAVLGSEAATEDGEDDEDDAFGDFVYHGKDVPPEKKAADYGRELAQVLGSAASDDAVSSNGTPNGGRELLRSSSPHPSTDTFPAQPLTPSYSFAGSLASAAFPNRPAAHPQISRLRSGAHQQRFASSSSLSTYYNPQQRRPAQSTASSAFDLQSRRSSTSNLHDLTVDLDALGSTSSSSSSIPTKAFRWSPLRRVTTRIYPPISSAGGAVLALATAGTGGGVAATTLGVPTVMSVSGVIAVGTSKGWVMVFDFGQNLKGVCGMEAIGKEFGAVTALAISQDHTFIAAGHALGAIYLYNLAAPSQPVRFVPPTTLALVLTGRKEGHLAGSRILHLGFVGARHTAIVSSDETGLAFYHSLGKVLMLASTDIIRMLGRYPEPEAPRLPGSVSPLDANGKPKSRKPTTILDMAALPLGPAPHSSDSHSLVALMTPSKLVVVGLKPTPRTWWRALPAKDGSDLASGAEYARHGVLAWFPSVTSKGGVERNGDSTKVLVEDGDDPLLAFAWGKRVRLVKVAREKRANGSLVAPRSKGLDIEFNDMEGWICDSLVLSLQWYSERVIFVLTANFVDVWDVQTRKRIGRDSHDVRNLISHDYYAGAFDASRPPAETLSYSASFRTHKRKLFLLTISDVRVGAVLSWADQILALMGPGSILEAIELTTSYLLGHVDASTIVLPEDSAARRALVEPKLREILNASLDFVFSEDRLRDGSHDDAASMQRLLGGLVGTCVRACVATGDVDWLFDDLYERYEQNGIQGIFLEKIEPFVLSGSVHALPPSVIQRLIAIHEERGQYEAAQRIIWHVDPENLDINQTLRLCRSQKLYDALIYVYTRSMHDFVAPIVDLLALVTRIQHHRKQRPRRVGDEEGLDLFTMPSDMEENVEGLVPDAYRIYDYLSQALSGLSYPSKEALSYEDGILARNSIYKFLFSGRTRIWPERGGRTILTSEDDRSVEPPYPYLRLLLQFDAEAMLDALDLAFEDPYLEDDIPGKPLTRQNIIDLLLEVMGPQDSQFTPIDRTFLHIFVARNLPKYPQFIELNPSILHDILVELATDSDLSTTEDRQLAAEYLLSSYSPHDGDAMIVLFERASFFRILRTIYRGERKWAALASTYLRDPDVGPDIFELLSETLRLSQGTNELQGQELAETILDAVPSLIQAHETGLQETAELFDSFLPSYHSDVIARLATNQWRQFAYLRYLLEPPSVLTDVSSTSTTHEPRVPTLQLDTNQRLLYLSLLCTNQPDHVIMYLEQDSLHVVDEAQAAQICEKAGVLDAVIWMSDMRGDTEEALDKVDSSLESRTDLLVKILLNGLEEEDAKQEAEEGDEAQVTRSQPERRRQPVTTSSTPSPEALLEQISDISKVAVDICIRRTSGPNSSPIMSGEDLWFRLLSSLVSTVRSIRTICPSPPRPSDRSSTFSSHRRSSNASIIIHPDHEVTPLSLVASDILSSLIPTALSSLVSTTSTQEVSFPTLMRRLIESNSRSPLSDRSSYAEFKSIVSSMLNTFVFEGEIFSITSKIFQSDLFQFVMLLKEGKGSGWRGEGNVCDECGEAVWGGEGEGGGGGPPAMTRSASVSMVVETMGMAGRPTLKKRPSLKGKEVEWQQGIDNSKEVQMVVPLTGIVVGSDGKIWHQRCHLLATAGVGGASNGNGGGGGDGMVILGQEGGLQDEPNQY